MATKSSVDAEAATQKLLTGRLAAFAEIKIITDQILLLDRSEIKVRRFANLEKELSSKLIALKKVNHSIMSSYLNEGLIEDEEVKNDQSEFMRQLFSITNIVDDYQDLVDKASPPAATPHGDAMIDIMRKINDGQVQMSKIFSDGQLQISKNFNKKKAPVMSQPVFDPKGKDGDYLAFKTFWSQFEIYIKDVHTDSEKLQFLKLCTKGQANRKIAALTISDSNYTIAVNSLKKDYENHDQIMADFF